MFVVLMRLTAILALLAAVGCSPEEQVAEPDVEESLPVETEPDETEPDETEPDETEPDEAEPDEAEPDVVEIVTFSEAMNYVCFYAALDHGFFEEQHIVIPDPLVVRSDEDVGRALFSGEAHVGLTGLTLLIPVEQGSIDLSIIGSNGDWVFAFMAPAEVEDIEELRGKTWVLQPPEAAAGAFSRLALDVALGEGEWEEVVVGGGGTTGRIAAVQAGEGDATVSNTPQAERIDSEGEFGIVGYLADIVPEFYEQGAIFALEEWLQENEDLAVRFMKALDDGCNFVADPANREEVEIDLARRFDLTPSVTTVVYEKYLTGDGIENYGLLDIKFDEQGGRRMVDVMVDHGILEGTLDLNQVIEHRYIDEARNR